MQKWEEKQRQKHHEHKIESARSSIQRYSSSKEKKSVHSRNSNNENSNDTTAPISKILEIFEFEKYGPLLQKYGFPASLPEEDYLKCVSKMLREVEEQDKEKFLSLINILKNMSKNMEKQTKTPKSMTKSVSQPRKIFYPHPPSQYSKLAKKSSQKSEKIGLKFKTKQQNIAINNSIEGGSELMISSPSEKNSPTTLNTHENDIEAKNRKRSTTCFNSRATDDLFLVHDFPLVENIYEEGILRTVKDSNKILHRLLEKLDIFDESTSMKETTDIKLEIDKIKNMYLSFDSATLTSNIINIDLDQMVECLSIEIKQMIVEGEVENLALSNADKILSLLHESFVLVREESKKSQNLETDEYLEEQYLEEKISRKESIETEFKELKCLKNISNKGSLEFKGSLDYLDISLDQSKEFESPNHLHKFQLMKEISFNEQSEIKIEDQFDTDKSSEEFPDFEENTSIDLNHQMKESSLWGNSYIASVINDFTCFDNIFGSSAFDEVPQQEDVKNFIEWVVHSGKMEKEVPILAYVYLKRLLNSPTVKNGKLTQKNWKNLMLVTLIEASKIWDDESLENHTFAVLIHPYTTLEINRLEKYLLFFLDYHLTIGQGEYSEAYFKLRKHTGHHDCLPSKDQLHFDLITIQKLKESGIYGTGKDSKKKTIEKKEFLKKLLNKSF